MLSTMVSILEVERLARDGPTPTSPRATHSPACGYHLNRDDRRAIEVHCGQVLRDLRLTPAAARPLWWAGAVYRAALATSADSMVHGQVEAKGVGASRAPKQQLRLDAASVRDAAVVAHLRSSQQAEGLTPVFAEANGAPVSLDNPVEVLWHCVPAIGRRERDSVYAGRANEAYGRGAAPGERRRFVIFLLTLASKWIYRTSPPSGQPDLISLAHVLIHWPRASCNSQHLQLHAAISTMTTCFRNGVQCVLHGHAWM